MPASSNPFLDWPAPLAFAHRGGASEAPENTLPAFERAVQLGYTYLETDVHVTADGVLVAFHDTDLSRTCGRPGIITELPWSDVSAARVGGREPIPLMEDLLEAFPDARFNIDCKSNAAVDALVAAIKRSNCGPRVCISAFDDRRLRRLRGALGPGVCTSLGPAQIAALRFLGRTAGGGAAAQVPVKQGRVTLVDERFVSGAHRRGLQVHVWTIDDADEMRRLLDLGVDGIMTDRPAVLRDVLVERGEWSGPVPGPR
ncbi:MAG TPA: glycerophosphodiester phosphodiesterase [Ilumatobacteraceae bacterium]|nr:glycerophosphodiester phosphodiesterase [Ilumatobacteraceae bacterium]